MDTSLLPSLIGVAFAAAWTPGPNNLMLMSSGALFGLRRTLPHIAGVQAGFTAVLAASVFGLGVLVAQFPWSVTIIKIMGAAWLFWLALGFFRAAFAKTGQTGNQADKKTDSPKRSRPLRFWEAAMFQWANPKALVMALATAAAYTGLAQTALSRAVILGGIFLVIGIGATVSWARAGAALNRLLSTGRRAQAMNIIMGLLLAATAIIVLTAKAS